MSGTGVPLLMFNGGPGCDDYLGPVAEMIKDMYRVIRFEPRGCGRVRLEVVPDMKRATLYDFINRTPSDTDELTAFVGMAGHDTRHSVVNHSMDQWVVGNIHTYLIEGVWASL